MHFYIYWLKIDNFPNPNHIHNHNPNSCFGSSEHLPSRIMTSIPKIMLKFVSLFYIKFSTFSCELTVNAYTNLFILIKTVKWSYFSYFALHVLPLFYPSLGDIKLLYFGIWVIFIIGYFILVFYFLYQIWNYSCTYVFVLISTVPVKEFTEIIHEVNKTNMLVFLDRWRGNSWSVITICQYSLTKM